MDVAHLLENVGMDLKLYLLVSSFLHQESYYYLFFDYTKYNHCEISTQTHILYQKPVLYLIFKDFWFTNSNYSSGLVKKDNKYLIIVTQHKLLALNMYSLSFSNQIQLLFYSLSNRMIRIYPIYLFFTLTVYFPPFNHSLPVPFAS